MREHWLYQQQIQEFGLFLQQEEREPATIQKYLRDAQAFAAWLGGRPVNKETVAAWKGHLLQKGYAPVTINAMLAAINQLCLYAGWPECRVKYLRIQKQLFRREERELKQAEYLRLLETAHRQGKHRLALLLETICATGVRVSEVAYITVEAARAGRTDVALKGKIRTILLPSKLCRKLLQYAKKEKIASGALFVTRSGKTLSRKQIWAEMKGLCLQAKVAPSKVFPHNLWHLFARTFYRVCRDVAKLADLLGHSSIETTRIYLSSTTAEHARQLERLGLVC